MRVVGRLLDRLMAPPAWADPARRRTPLALDPSEHLAGAHGLPHPLWDRIAPLIDAAPPDFTPHDYYCDAVEWWLRHLGEALGPHMRFEESRRFMLLSPLKEPRRALRFLEAARADILDLLGDAAWTDVIGKHVVVLFNSVETYYSYIAPYFPETGEFGLSAGVCIQSHYVHIAAPLLRGQEYQVTLVHELVHEMLSHRQLPQWVEEGAAQMVEHRYGARPLLPDAAHMRGQYRHWRRHGLESFWNGTAFTAPDDRQRLSYALAEILVTIITERYRGRLVDFLLRATRADAGEAAAREVFGSGLATLVHGVLGDGDWTPRPLAECARNSGPTSSQ